AARHLRLESAATGYSERREAIRLPVAILVTVAGLVLLIACANVASLLLARSGARRREIAVRAAIGAGRGRLARQLMTESIVRSAVAGACGLLLAAWGSRILASMISAGTASSGPMALDIRLDLRVFGFAAAVSGLTAVCFGLAPAILATRRPFAPALAVRGSAGARLGLSRGILVAQVALTIVLICAAGLLLRTLRTLQTQEIGFTRENLLLAWISPAQTGRSGAALLPLLEQIRQSVAALPRVRAVSISNGGVLEGGEDRGGPSEETSFDGLPPK